MEIQKIDNNFKIKRTKKMETLDGVMVEVVVDEETRSLEDIIKQRDALKETTDRYLSELDELNLLINKMTQYGKEKPIKK